MSARPLPSRPDLAEVVRAAKIGMKVAKSRLRAALLAGENTSGIREEIDDLRRRQSDAAAADAEHDARAEQARVVRITSLRAIVASQASAQIADRLAALAPPAHPETPKH